MRRLTLTAASLALTAAALVPAPAQALPDGWDCNPLKSSDNFDWSAYRYCRDAGTHGEYRVRVWVVKPPYPSHWENGTWQIPGVGGVSYVSWDSSWTFDHGGLQGS